MNRSPVFTCRLLAVAALLGAALAVPPAVAAAPAFVRLVHLTGNGTQSCPGAETFEQAVAARVPRFPFSEVAPTLLVVLIERAAAGGYAGRLFLRDDVGTTSGQRQMRLASCAELTESLAIAASVLLTPLAQEHPPAASPGTRALPAGAMRDDAPGSEQDAGPGADQPAAPEPLPLVDSRLLIDARRSATIAARPAGHPRWQLGIGPSLAYEPGQRQGAPVATGAALSLAAVGERFALGLEARGVLPRTQRWTYGQISSHTLALALLPCWRPGAVVLCSSASAGLVRARGQGFDINQSATRPVAGAGLRVGYELGEGRLRLRPQLSVEVPLLRWRFTVDQTMAGRQAPISASLGLELLARLP
jgi:hypothetical protein